MTKDFKVAYERIIISLKKYSSYNKIPIKRARYTISTIHRMPNPYCTRIINELNRAGWIKLINGSGYMEILI